MENTELNEAIVVAIKDSAIPRIDKARLVEHYGAAEAENLAHLIAELIQEAVKMPIEWGDMTLEQGVNDIMARFQAIHPALSEDALHEIARCVGWNWR